MTRRPKGRVWTPKELEAIPATWEGDRLHDGEGLFGEVKVLPDGSISIPFKYSFRINKQKTSLYHCGTYPKDDLKKIREERNKARIFNSQGIDPRLQKKADRIESKNKLEQILEEERKKREEELVQNKTLNHLYDAWTQNGLKSRNDNGEALKKTLAKHILPYIGAILLKDLSEKNLIDVYLRIIEEKKFRTAIVVASGIRQMFQWASIRKPWKLIIEEDPSLLVAIDDFIPEDYQDQRERVLSKEEITNLKEIFKKINLDYKNNNSTQGLKTETQIAMWIMLSSICRIGELLKAEWKHIDIEKKTWFIPKENVKGRKRKKHDLVVYLSGFTFKKLMQLHKISGESKWLFPAENNLGALNEKTMSKQIGDRQIKFKNLTKKLSHRVGNNLLVLGDEKWTPHDLRRTGGTMMQMLSVSEDIINRCQNHIVFENKISSVYLKHKYEDDKKDAWKKLGLELDKLLKN
ncbi:tyrosine-type recombinase/integrase [Candidatus Methylopumilus planktonicus]|uniref:tyrosine-type recombinase/integrase n=1 Tax=Candidatus Methylopumilus planktonicus TaxID=1581557 RepID=UPI003D18FB4A